MKARIKCYKCKDHKARRAFKLLKSGRRDHYCESCRDQQQVDKKERAKVNEDPNRIKTCPGCRTKKQQKKFYFIRALKRFDNVCILCRNEISREYARMRKIKKQGKQRCSKCKQNLAMDKFASNGKWVDHICKECRKRK